MFSRDSRYEKDVERRIATGNRVNDDETAKRQHNNCAFRRTKCSVGTDAVIRQRNVDYRRRMKERLILWRCDLLDRRVCGVSLSLEKHRTAGTIGEAVTLRMKKNVFSWFGHVELGVMKEWRKRFIIEK